MSRLIDLTGKRFNNLVVIERVENAKGGVARWKCRCDCGNYTIVRGRNLKNGAVKSCGCLRKTPPSLTHGMSNTRIYHEWLGIRSRTSDKKSHAYKYYGERGISVCDEWKDDFMAFYKWAMENGYSDELTIERKDCNSDYSPENCCWITKSEQANNRRMNHKIEYNGKIYNLMELCDELNLDYKRVHNRIKKLGWSVEKAISTPAMTQKRNMEARKKYG